MTAVPQGMAQASSAVVKKVQASPSPADLARRRSSASADEGKAMADIGRQAPPLFE
jgi:hypothetical protein